MRAPAAGGGRRGGGGDEAAALGRLLPAAEDPCSMIVCSVEIDAIIERAILTRCASSTPAVPSFRRTTTASRPLTRVDLDDVCQLVRNKRCFVLHAPRQTGKTSVLLALRDLLNGGAIGDYRCVYSNVEVGQAAREGHDPRDAGDLPGAGFQGTFDPGG